MENNTLEQKNIGLLEIKENSKEEHWAKKYGVSVEELNEAGNDLDISARIVKVGHKNKAFSL